jgi:hypothetical protein
MTSRVNATLYISNDGRRVDVVGPITWDPDEQCAFFSVVISQPSGAPTVHAIGVSGRVARGTGTWTATASVVEAGARLQPGTADALAVATIVTFDKPEYYPWELTTDLRPAAVAAAGTPVTGD